MRRFRLSFFLVLAGTLASVAGARAQVQPANVTWAERMVAQVTPADNYYGSHPTIVRWAGDGQSARNRSVCSSFQTHVFERAYGLKTADITRWFGLANPQAKDYYDTIAAGRGFTKIAHVEDLQPGDIIAVKYPPGSKPTGHVMMIDGPVHPHRSTKPLESGMQQYEVAVIDSSHSFHGKLDTRYRPGAKNTGVGRGTLRLYAAADGTATGYTWSTRAISEFYPESERHIVFGRYAGVPHDAAPAVSEDDGDDGVDAQQ